jgi:hypothetical protein
MMDNLLCKIDLEMDRQEGSQRNELENRKSANEFIPY